jgi:hypothetical protein
MIWSDHEEALFQLRRRRRRVLRKLLLVTVSHGVGAILLEMYSRHHRALHVVIVMAFAASLAGLGSAAVLGARWGLSSNAAESWSANTRGMSGRKAQRAHRELAVRDGTRPTQR